jgi:hypothetical protein
MVAMEGNQWAMVARHTGKRERKSLAMRHATSNPQCSLFHRTSQNEPMGSLGVEANGRIHCSEQLNGSNVSANSQSRSVDIERGLHKSVISPSSGQSYSARASKSDNEGKS